MVMAEGIMNNHPLMVISNDPNDLEPLVLNSLAAPDVPSLIYAQCLWPRYSLVMERRRVQCLVDLSWKQ